MQIKKQQRLTAENCVDTEAECFYQYVYGSNDAYNPHCHDFYEIFFTVSGTVTHMVNGITYKLPEGCLVFIRPDDFHAYIYDTPESTNSVYINLTFTRNTAKLLFEYLADDKFKENLLSCDMPPAVTLDGIEKKRLLSKISELNIVNWKDKNELKLRMRAILAEIFVRFFYNIENKHNETLPVWLSKLISDMEKPVNFTQGTEKMIELSQKSREHIARSLKKYLGMTSAEYINELRLNYASNLLLRTNTPIVDICYSCGFQSVSYFYDVFKKKYGFSPNKFRKQYKE